MGLYAEDRIPKDISFKDAYAAVRAWYQANVDRLVGDDRVGRYAAEAKPYIEALPPPDKATEGDMKDCLRRVLHSDLEFAYHESDGSYKMAAYAHGAFEAAGEDPFAG